VCGAQMYPIKKRPKIGYVVYKCFHCKRTERRWTKPWKKDEEEEVVREKEAEQIRSILLDDISETVIGLLFNENYLEELEDEWM